MKKSDLQFYMKNQYGEYCFYAIGDTQNELKSRYVDQGVGQDADSVVRVIYSNCDDSAGVIFHYKGSYKIAISRDKDLLGILSERVKEIG